MKIAIDYKPEKAWAWRLKEREESGAQLNSTQRAMWRDALKGELTQADQAQPGTSDDLDEAKYRSAQRVADYVRERVAA